jgi:hypothetical protein
MTEELVPVTFIISPRVDTIIKQLGHRRYGDDPMAADKVIHDALQWQIDRWKTTDTTLTEHIWLKLINFPIAWIRKIAWGQILMPYFDGMVEDDAVG